MSERSASLSAVFSCFSCGLQFSFASNLRVTNTPPLPPPPHAPPAGRAWHILPALQATYLDSSIISIVRDIASIEALRVIASIVSIVPGQRTVEGAGEALAVDRNQVSQQAEA